MNETADTRAADLERWRDLVERGRLTPGSGVTIVPYAEMVAALDRIERQSPARRANAPRVAEFSVS